MLVGMAVGGPLGLVLGGIIGTILDIYFNPIDRFVYRKGELGLGIVALTAAVLRTDGRKLAIEIAFVQNSFNRQFGEKYGKGAYLLLQEVLEGGLNLRKSCYDARSSLSASSRVKLLQFLFKLAYHDDQIKMEEIKLIVLISTYLGVSEEDLFAVKSQYLGSDADPVFNYKSSSGKRRSREKVVASINLKIIEAYSILGILNTATIEEIKQSYRQKAMIYHPDKVNQLDMNQQSASNAAFLKINDAYRMLKKERKFN